MNAEDGYADSYYDPSEFALYTEAARLRSQINKLFVMRLIFARMASEIRRGRRYG